MVFCISPYFEVYYNSKGFLNVASKQALLFEKFLSHLIINFSLYQRRYDGLLLKVILFIEDIKRFFLWTGARLIDEAEFIVIFCLF